MCDSSNWKKKNYAKHIIISCRFRIPETCREVPLSSTIPLTSLKMTLWPVWRPCGWLSIQVTTPGLPCKGKTETLQTVGWKRRSCYENPKKLSDCFFVCFFLKGWDYLSDSLDENLLGLLSSGVWHLKLLSEVTEDPDTDAVSIRADELAERKAKSLFCSDRFKCTRFA